MVGSVGSFGTSVGSMLLVSFALRKMKISSMESDGVTTGRSWPLCNQVRDNYRQSIRCGYTLVLDVLKFVCSCAVLYT